MTTPRRALLAILLASLALRIVLVWSGGQLYWPDELRYVESRAIVKEIASGETAQALARLDSADHLLFKVIALIPAAIEHIAGADTRIPGIFFAIFSVLDIGLVALIARRLGASERESVVAAGMLALSSAFFYYSRHLLPYDVAMTWGLAAIYCGLSRGGLRSSLACGVLAACAFLTYAGYWTLGAAAILLHALDTDRVIDAVRRAIWSAFATLATIGLVLVINAALGGHLLGHFLGFAATIDQGDYAEGWLLPFAYLWHAEHALLLVWLAAAGFWISRMRRALDIRRVKIALAGFVFVYASLALASTALHAFVVYGRLARQLVPFLCILAAAALEELWAESSPARRYVPAILALLVVQAAANFFVPLRQVFPSELLGQAIAFGENLIPGARTMYIRHIWPAPEAVAMPAGYVVLRQASHPLQFLPYQYEGYDPATRNALRSMDIRMRVIAPAR